MRFLLRPAIRVRTSFDGNVEDIPILFVILWFLLPWLVSATADPNDSFPVIVSIGFLAIGMFVSVGTLIWFIVGLVCIRSEGTKVLHDAVAFLVGLAFFASVGLSLAYTTTRYEKARQDQAVLAQQYAERMNRELQSFPWQSVSSDLTSTDQVTDHVLIVDADTHTVSRWHKTLVSPACEPNTLSDCDFIALIEEEWVSSATANWVTFQNGREVTKRPVRYRKWHVSLMDVKNKNIVAQKSFAGLIENVNFVNLSQRYRTDAEIEEWERNHCLPPSEQVMSWLGIPRKGK